MIGTVAGTLVMTIAQGWMLRGQLGGIEGRRLLASTVRMLAAAALLAGAAYGVWYGLDEALGRSLLAQIASVGLGDRGGRGRLRGDGVGARRARGAPDPSPAASAVRAAAGLSTEH